MSARRVALALTLVTAVLTGCAPESKDEPSTTPSVKGSTVAVAKMAHLVGVLEQAPRGPGVGNDVTVVDLVAARAAASASADADPLAGAGLALGALGAAWSAREYGGIDLDQVTMAGTIDHYGAEVTVLATGQPLAEVVQELPALGFREAGDVWMGDGTTEVTQLSARPDALVSTTIPGRRGRQAIRTVVRDLEGVESDTTDNAFGALARDLLTTQEAPGLRMLPVDSGAGPWRCLQAITTLESFTVNGGQIVFTPTSDPEQVSLPLVESDDGVPWATYRFGEPALLDNSWWVDVTLDASASPVSNSLLGFSDRGSRGGSLVSCTG